MAETKKNFWNYGLGAFWAVVITMNIAFVYIATTNKSDLVTEKYYQAGVDYQSIIDATKAYNTMFPNSDLIYENKRISLDLGIKDSLNPIVHLRRSDNPLLDRELQLNLSDSTFKSKEIDLQKGPYKAEIKFINSGILYVKVFNIWVK